MSDLSHASPSFPNAPADALLLTPVPDEAGNTLKSQAARISYMYQVLFPEGQLGCERFEETDNGVRLYNAADDFVAFVPYANLHAIIDEENIADDDREPSVM